jgi:hypothetical protein
MQTEFLFELPRGYVDGEGRVHRQGVMRLATAMDEIAPLRDMRVRANEAYLSILVLSSVVARLGDVPQVTPHVIENLFAADMAYLQDFYRRINETGANTVEVVCPNCKTVFREEIIPLGE